MTLTKIGCLPGVVWDNSIPTNALYSLFLSECSHGFLYRPDANIWYFLNKHFVRGISGSPVSWKHCAITYNLHIATENIGEQRKWTTGLRSYSQSAEGLWLESNHMWPIPTPLCLLHGTEWDTLGIVSSKVRNDSCQRGLWIWLCLLGAWEGVPSTTYFLDFREEPGTWYPGLHLYLQKDPTLCLFSRHLAVCRSALGTGGGARHMSSHRASGKDHSPSSIQVRMLLLPGRHRQAGLAEQWVHTWAAWIWTNMQSPGIPDWKSNASL